MIRPTTSPIRRDSIAARAERAGPPGGRGRLRRDARRRRPRRCSTCRRSTTSTAPRRRRRACSPTRSSVVGLSDGGAHVGTICDASFPTTLLAALGPRPPHGRPAARARSCTSRPGRRPRRSGCSTAACWRRATAPTSTSSTSTGLRLHTPEIRYDLPAGGRRLIQRADGYLHTFVAGTEIRTDGESTGATPGRLVRGAAGRPGAQLTGRRPTARRRLASTTSSMAHSVGAWWRW